ncbi:hypothetical protein DTL42_05245 [Bremerella cremea]|uniref:Uncharacterized protein n=1 Tax=Bremerella cremea TaxID=1031537 RepID=A0A368KY89_9BACT|nr:hypothetical protein [Bremerella cremea]RCS54544.1 hypothetical protein DTL42_05245 [Bremerella cremea]
MVDVTNIKSAETQVEAKSRCASGGGSQRFFLCADGSDSIAVINLFFWQTLPITAIFSIATTFRTDIHFCVTIPIRPANRFRLAVRMMSAGKISK